LPFGFRAIIIQRLASVKAAVLDLAPEMVMLSDQRRGSPRDLWFVVALSLLIILGSAAPAWAWGRLGHRVSTRIAEKYLNPRAKAAIAELLAPGESLADASLWADDYRGQHRNTAPWHYVDVPLDEAKYDSRWSADDPKHGCIVDKVAEFRATMNDKTKSVDDRRFALRFLVHLVEDLH